MTERESLWWGTCVSAKGGHNGRFEHLVEGQNGGGGGGSVFACVCDRYREREAGEGKGACVREGPASPKQENLCVCVCVCVCLCACVRGGGRVWCVRYEKGTEDGEDEVRVCAGFRDNYPNPNLN